MLRSSTSICVPKIDFLLSSPPPDELADSDPEESDVLLSTHEVLLHLMSAPNNFTDDEFDLRLERKTLFIVYGMSSPSVPLS